MTMYGVLADHEIAELCSGDQPMLDPFLPDQRGKPSYGLGSFGYDLRLGSCFLVPVGGLHEILDPVDFLENHFREHEAGESFELLPSSQVLSESVEWFNMPDDVCAMCWGKSSYARCGLLVNITPLEPGWNGKLTMALVNVSRYPIRLHVGQGIAQAVFFRGRRPSRTYAEKESGGEYQNQPGVTLPK
ncbi:dCTP deaminase [Candidatus Bipolaricaulota bacterium]